MQRRWREVQIFAVASAAAAVSAAAAAAAAVAIGLAPPRTRNSRRRLERAPARQCAGCSIIGGTDRTKTKCKTPEIKFTQSRVANKSLGVCGARNSG